MHGERAGDGAAPVGPSACARAWPGTHGVHNGQTKSRNCEVQSRRRAAQASRAWCWGCRDSHFRAIEVQFQVSSFIFPKILPLAAQAHFVTAAGGLPRLTAARHAACAHSTVRGARPGVKWAKLQAHTASAGCAKSRLPAQRQHNSRVLRPSQPARHAAPRPTTRPALAPRAVEHGPMPYRRSLCSYGAHTGQKMRGWSWEAGWGRSRGRSS